MHIESVKIKNFKTLQKDNGSFEMELDPKFQVIAGANNSGKSNLLRALNLFFNGVTENERAYSREKDLSFHKGIYGTGSPVNTEIEVDLFLEDDEIKKISKLENFVYNKNIIRTKFIYRGNNTYWYFSNKSDGEFPKKIDSNLIKDAANPIRVLFRRIKFIFIPTHADLTNKINDLVAEEILPSMIDGYGDSALAQKIKTLKDKIDELDLLIKDVLKEKNQLISKKFQETIKDFPEIQAEIPIKEFALEVALKDDSLTSVLSKRIDLLVKDSSHNTIESKGSGIQKMVLVTLLEYFSQNIESKARYTNPFLIWAIDEPESFMQPKLQKKLREILEKVSKTHQIIITTHSPNLINVFSPENVKLFYLKTEAISVARKGNKKFFKKETRFFDKNGTQFIDKLRDHLGIEMNDGWMLQDKNILFEGQDDIVYFHSTFKAFNGYSLAVSNISCESSTNIPPFVELLYQKIANKKISGKALICLVDNDNSGRDAHKKIKAKSYLKTVKTISLYLNSKDNKNEHYPSMIEDFVVPEVFFEAVIAYLRESKSLPNVNKFKVGNFINARGKAKRTPMTEFLDNHFDSVIKKIGKFTFKNLSIKYGIALKYQDIILGKKEDDIKKYKKSYPELTNFLDKFK